MRIGILLAASITSATLAAAAQAQAPAYVVTKTIAGPDGGWDYARVDPAAHRLYVARSDAVTVVDLAGGGPVRSIGSLRRGHAVVPLPGSDMILVTSGTDGTVSLLDAVSGKEAARLEVGKKPDAAILDAAGTQAFVMNSDSGTISLIDLASSRVIRTIPVKPALEYAAFGNSGTLFINDEDANEIEVVDVARGTTGKPIALPGCEGPTGLGYDRLHDRLIAACANGKAAIVDAHAKRLVVLLPIGTGADAVIVDDARGLAFIPCGKDGVLDILSITGTAVAHIGRVRTETGARTGALDPTTGVIYLPTAKFAPAVAGGRPTPLPGSFHILVVNPG